MAAVGPWGGRCGCNPWTFKPDGRISEIRIRSGGCIDSIRFTYTDQVRVPNHSQTITLADDEDIIRISGTFRVFEGVLVITSLSFQTNKTTYGPYGTTMGTSFSLPVTKGMFIGFNGNCGDFLHSFAVSLHSDWQG